MVAGRLVRLVFPNAAHVDGMKVSEANVGLYEHWTVSRGIFSFCMRVLSVLSVENYTGDSLQKIARGCFTKR